MYRLLLVIPVCAVLQACAPEARWPQETSLQVASPDTSPVPEAIATAVQWWMTREPTSIAEGPVTVELAPALAAAQAPVQKLLPDCTVTTDAEHTASAITVVAVRMHHASAEIDLDAPRRMRGRQLITLDMQKFLLTPWDVTGATWWRFNDRQLHRITRQAAEAASESEDNSTDPVAEDAPEDVTTADASDP